jgi:hypothetical protein
VNLLSVVVIKTFLILGEEEERADAQLRRHHQDRGEHRLDRLSAFQSGRERSEPGQRPDSVRRRGHLLSGPQRVDGSHGRTRQLAPQPVRPPKRRSHDFVKLSCSHVSVVPSLPTVDRSKKPDTFDTHYARTNLRIVIVPALVMLKFQNMAQKSTLNNIETCGILAGKLVSCLCYVAKENKRLKVGGDSKCNKCIADDLDSQCLVL